MLAFSQSDNLRQQIVNISNTHTSYPYCWIQCYIDAIRSAYINSEKITTHNLETIQSEAESGTERVYSNGDVSSEVVQC